MAGAVVAALQDARMVRRFVDFAIYMEGNGIVGSLIVRKEQSCGVFVGLMAVIKYARSSFVLVLLKIISHIAPRTVEDNQSHCSTHCITY